MNRFVERAHNQSVSSFMQSAADTAAAKMAPTVRAEDRLQSPMLPNTAAHDPASPVGIAKAVVALLASALAATVDSAVQRGLEQLHLDLQSQAQWITQTDEQISSLEDEAVANSATLARMSNSHIYLWEKLDDFENRSRCNNLCVVTTCTLYRPLYRSNPELSLCVILIMMIRMPSCKNSNTLEPLLSMTQTFCSLLII